MNTQKIISKLLHATDDEMEGLFSMITDQIQKEIKEDEELLEAGESSTPIRLEISIDPELAASIREEQE